MKTRRLIFVESVYRDRGTIWCGTVKELVNDVFGYTLECGHSCNQRIQRYPKTAASLEKSLNRSSAETNNFTSYSLVTRDEYLSKGGVIPETGTGSVRF